MDQRLQMRMEASGPEELLFQLGYALQPHCPAELKHWSSGAAVEVYDTQASGNSESASKVLADRNAILKGIAPDVAPGERVVFADRLGTPQGVAGIKAGDVVLKSESATDSKFIPAPPGASLLERARRINEELQRLQLEADRKHAAQPVESWKVRRAGEVRSVEIRYVEVCSMVLRPVDSKLRYTDASDGTIYLTLPLLKSLSGDEMKVVLALEASQVALAMTMNRAQKSAIGGLVLPLAINRETGVQAASAEQLQIADPLAVRLALTMGIEPDRYVETLKKLSTYGGFFEGWEYSVIRPLRAQRLENLESAARAWKETRQLTLPVPQPAGIVEKVQERLRQALNEPQRIFSAEEK